MSAGTLETMRRVQRRLEAEFAHRIDWRRFSLTAVRDAVARQIGGTILLTPFHWETRCYFGLALGCSVQDRPRWLVLYEQDAGADHLLMIVLHELMHIALEHRDALISPEELRRLLASLGLIIDWPGIRIHAHVCMPGPRLLLPGRDAREEAEAELAAAWAVTRARQAGGLPPVGRTFAPEHVAISTFLAGTDGL